MFGLLRAGYKSLKGAKTHIIYYIIYHCGCNNIELKRKKNNTSCCKCDSVNSSVITSVISFNTSIYNLLLQRFAIIAIILYNCCTGQEFNIVFVNIIYAHVTVQPQGDRLILIHLGDLLLIKMIFSSDITSKNVTRTLTI